jgi:hypothetical protein
MSLFPDDSAERKTYPLHAGLLAYFPSALAAVARHSYVNNEKHNPGQPVHWDRAKSGDELDAMVRHLLEGDYVGMAWRALAFLQKHLESKGAPVAPAAKNAVLRDPAPAIDPAAVRLEAAIERAESDDPDAHDGRPLFDPSKDEE